MPGMATATATAKTAPGRRTGAWVFAGAQLAYAVWFVLAAWLALTRAAHFAGHYYIPAQADVHTAGADVDDGWPWAPALASTAMMGPLFAAVSILVSAGMLVLGHLRGRRALTLTALVGTVAVLATVVVALSPAGRSVSGWLID
jgi:hypothetical protein